VTHAIAVQKLAAQQRDAIARHLLRLPAEDRRLRFGQAMRDDAIERYVSGIDFGRDRVFAILGPDMGVAGLAHLALDDEAQHAELGLSVDAGMRVRGYGGALLKRAVLHAGNRGYRALFMHCLAENSVMMHLAAKAGLRIVLSGGEADGRLALSGEHGGALREAMEDQFALVDYLLKQQASLIRSARSPHSRSLPPTASSAPARTPPPAIEAA
jgi:RimJ/RimL family protein N-acetyltransferase